MAGLRIHVVMPAELVENIDAAKGPEQSRGDFIRWCVIGELAARVGRPTVAEREALDAEGVRPAAPAEQPRRAGPDVAAFRRATQR